LIEFPVPATTTRLALPLAAGAILIVARDGGILIANQKVILNDLSAEASAKAEVKNLNYTIVNLS